MHGFFARLKNIFGGQAQDVTLAAAATLDVPDHAGFVDLTGTATITALRAPAYSRRRVVFFRQSDSGTTTFTNTDDTTTANEMDLGGSNVALGQTDVICLRLLSNGSWLRVFSTNN
jgi:hypothetical protein